MTRGNQSDSSGKPHHQVVISVIGALASIAVAWIAANASAKPAAQAALDNQLPSIDSLSERVRRADASVAVIEGIAARFAVVAFNLENCPAGWRAFEPGRGRYIVGLTRAGRLGYVVGKELTDGENRVVGKHSHDYGRFLTLGGKAPSKDGAIAWGKVNDAERRYHRDTVSHAGVFEGSNAPYVQLLLCERL